MAKTETGYAFMETTEEQHKSHICSLRHLVEVLEKNCKFESSDTFATIEPEKRQILINAFGHYGAEAIVLSNALGAVLWTDDQAQAMFARSEYGVTRIWTQIMIQMYVDSGIINPEVYFDASAKLVGFGYYFTSESAEVIRQAGIIAEWKSDVWPLSQVLNTFGEESIELEQMLQLAAESLRLLYQETILPDTKAHITVVILENIAKRQGGLRGIHRLEKALPSYFGLDVIGLVNASSTVEAWRKGTEGRLFVF